MFQRTAGELSRMTNEQLIQHYVRCVRTCNEFPNDLGIGDQNYIGIVQRYLTTRGIDEADTEGPMQSALDAYYYVESVNLKKTLKLYQNSR